MPLSVNRLLAKLRCSACLQIIHHRRVALCAHGHSVCSECRESTVNCPLCGSLFSGNGFVLAENTSAFTRSYIKLVRNCIKSLKNSLNAKGLSQEIFPCRVCGSIFVFAALVSHFETAHPGNVLKNGQTRHVLKQETTQSLMYTFQLEHDGSIYWFWRRNEKAVRFGLQYVGGGDPAEMKMFVLDVKSPDNKMSMRLEYVVSPTPTGPRQIGVVATKVLGIGARYRVTII